ncbi:hypothetical protein B7P43_G07837 [Cryptotermes secundus]|uniref:Mariner Mos1 transposase n=1 Tax=Cryptotermes secundus TaxID=105785 RepID=A0A2J7QL93_9NEOP|nr:hypothetical protein B7P43_G07837 [Cryptotermes secundus]
MLPVYGGKCLSSKAVHNWVDKFPQVRSKVVDCVRSGLPVEIATEATVQRVEELIRVDRRITEEMNRMGLSLQHLLRYVEEGEDLLNTIITGDESWVHIYEPDSNCASMHWKYPTSLSGSTKNFKVTSSAGKFMLAAFCDSQGVLSVHFQNRGENMNFASYREVLLKMRDAIRRKRPCQLAKGLLLHHDNAGPHTCRATQERIQELQWELLEHPPYSPDLAPSDFHLSDPLRDDPDGKSFADDEEVETECRSG